MAKNKYTAEDFDVLSSISGIRKNVGMYLGGAETQVLHTLREVVENSIDVYIKDMNDYVSVVVEGDKKRQNYIIIDHGPGIPIEKHKKLKKSILELVLTRVHAGSNFDKKTKGKKKTRGKHGTGVSTVVATAKNCIVYTCRDNQWYTISFKKGKKQNEVTKTKLPSKYKKYGAKKKLGTIIEYTPDYTVLPNTILTHKDLKKWAATVANLNTGLKVNLIYNGKQDKFLNKKGFITALDAYKEEKSSKKTEFIGKPFVYEGDDLKIALQWGNLEGDNHFLSYVNGAETVGGGTHVQGAYDTITKVFKKVLSKGIDFSASDLREGMVLVIHYKCDDDDYAGQNKEKLNSASATNIVKKLLEKPLSDWVEKNKKTAKKIVRRASEIAKAKKQAKALTRAASNVKSSAKKGLLLANKLTMCDKRTKSEDRELFLVEGDSAGGAVKAARNPKFQEVLSCRGKGLNVVKASLAKILANKEISSMLVALSGADIKDIVKVGTILKFRIGKIMLFPDADTDGDHISTLWLSVLLKFAPAAFEQGIVYKVQSPLYIDSEDKLVYGFSLKEIQKKMNPKHYHRIVRCKGLGEFTSDQIEPFINPETRHLVKLTQLSKKQAIEMEKLMGNDTTYRRKLLGIQERPK